VTIDDVKANLISDDRSVLGDRRLRWFVIGELAGMLLDQIWFVALSWWLVASQGAGASVGAVLAVAAVPRAVFMLVGGAVTDRRSPTAVLRVTSIARFVALGAAFVVALGPSPLWQLCVLAALFGTIDGLASPAEMAMIPFLANGTRLVRLNAVVQLGDQISQVVGPALAAILLASGGVPMPVAGAAALGLVVVVAFGCVRRLVGRVAVAGASGATVGRDIVEGARYAWSRRDLRAYLAVIAGLGLGTVGPMTLGSALLARERFGGPSSLGWLLGAFGVGALLGTLAAGARPPGRSPKSVLVVLCAAVALGMAGLAWAPTLPVAVVIAAVAASSWGYESVVTASWLQSTTDAKMQGRVSSLLAFSFMALDPVSQALTGVVSGLGAGAVFAAGAVVVAMVGAVVAGSRWAVDQPARPQA
jgi:Na+/melibiose symporter-like transporter